MEKKFKVDSLSDLKTVAQFIAQLSNEYSHFCLEAEMGAGKTTLINQVCKELGVSEHTSSPTYSIVNEYKTDLGKSIYHFDLYRLKNEEELLDIGIIEILESYELCFFEWPEKILSYLDEKFVNLTIEVINNTRFITLNY
jgi:tRNA threonylcarbamoyladenosine biosynthesis protein TsaE